VNRLVEHELDNLRPTETLGPRAGAQAGWSVGAELLPSVTRVEDTNWNYAWRRALNARGHDPAVAHTETRWS